MTRYEFVCGTCHARVNTNYRWRIQLTLRLHRWLACRSGPVGWGGNFPGSLKDLP